MGLGLSVLRRQSAERELAWLKKRHPGCYVHAPDPHATLEMAPEEREALWEKLHAEPEFGIW
jgi:hypothetical protein